jgi:hypothetical protein
MKFCYFPQTFGLVAILLMASCAPTNPVPAVDTIPQNSDSIETSVPAPTVSANSSVPQATDVPSQAVEVQAVATSRGPNLEATDPATVNLASGQLQLIEFFRFT